MFRSKRDLDNHVLETLAKISTEKEKIKRCLGFARAYYSLREFETARRYLEDYLKSNEPNMDIAHKLQGDILVELGRHDLALGHYKKSYELGKSRDVLNKVCSLIQNGYGVNETAHTRTNWLNLQKASSTLQQDDSSSNLNCPRLFSETNGISSPPVNQVFPRTVSGTGLFGSTYMSPSKARLAQLKANGNGNGNVASENIGENLRKLITSNKATVLHHSALLQFYLSDKKIRDAASHVHKYMLKYAHNYEFLEKSVIVMEEAIQDHLSSSRSVIGVKLSEAELFSAYFFTLENFVALLLDKTLKDVIPEAVGDKRLALAAHWLHKFDQQLLLKARQVKFSTLESWWPPFLKHCRAQLLFFIGNLILLRSEKDAKHVQLVYPCFTLASSFVVEQPISMIKLKDPKLQQRAFIESCYRVFVCKSVLLDQEKSITFTAELKEVIYDLCFPIREQPSYSTSKATSEFFSIQPEAKSILPPDPSVGLSEEKFWLYLKVAQLLYPDSLHHQVWLHARAVERLHLLHPDEDPTLMCHSVVFEEVPLNTFSSSDIKVEVDSICQQDVDVFLTLSVSLSWEFKLKSYLGLKNTPGSATNLVTDAQAKWWSSAYKFTHGASVISSSDWAATECRVQVQRGLEMIRNLENTLPVSLMNIQGAAFASAALSLEKTGVAKQFLHLPAPVADLYQIYFDGAENYYRMFVESYTEPKKKPFYRFFDVKNFPELPIPTTALGKARFILGWRAMERRDYETALFHFAETSFAEATLFSAEIYKFLADEELEMSGNADSGAKFKALLQKAQELLYETLDRRQKKPVEYLLGKTSVEFNRAPLPHPKLENELELHEMIDEVESKLRTLAMNISVAGNQSFNLNGFSNALDEIQEGMDRLDGSNLSESQQFIIKTPATVGRRPQRESGKEREHLYSSGFIAASTPKRSETENRPSFEVRSFVAENDMRTAEEEAVFADSLEKLLEQNSVILDTISQMEDEIKDLNDRFENLKKSKKLLQRKNRAVSFQVPTVVATS